MATPAAAFSSGLPAQSPRSAASVGTWNTCPASEWRQWTGLRFDTDGRVILAGALSPVFVSSSDDVAVYVEPNVWIEHRKP